LELIRIRIEDIDGIVDIHYEAFPNSRTTKLGKPYLRKMYSWFCENKVPLALAIMEGDKVIGFAIGDTQPPAERLYLVCWKEITISFLKKPVLLIESGMLMRLINRCLAIMRYIFREKKPVNLGKCKEFHTAYLFSIAVKPELQGKRIGGILVKAFEDKAIEQGCSRVMVHTEADNIKAGRLYQKAGFILEERIKNTNRFVKYLS